MAAEHIRAGITLGDLLSGVIGRSWLLTQEAGFSAADSSAVELPPGSISQALSTTLLTSIADLQVSGLELDSRKVKPGDVFIAVPGFDQNNPTDGRQFVHQAIAGGAVAVLAEHGGWTNIMSRRYSVPIVLIEKLAALISAIAGRFYGQPGLHLDVVGVTGTNGKTTCTHLLAELLNHLDVKTGVVGTLGYGVPHRLAGRAATAGQRSGLTDIGLTTPDAVTGQAILAEMRANRVSCVAIEVSSHSLDQGRVNAIPIRGAVFTNLSQDHLDYHGSMKAYLAAKEKLFKMPGLEFAVINIDDPAGLSLAQSLDSGIQCYPYSLQARSPVHPESSVTANNIHVTGRGIEAEIISPWGEARLSSQLVGEFNLSNILAVIAVACASGLAFDKAVAAATQLRPAPGRLEVINDGVGSGSGPRVIIDYAHTPDALSKTLSTLRRVVDDLGGETPKIPGAAAKLWCVFGCGGDRDKGKRPAMGAIADKLADVIIITSDNPRSEVPAAIIDDIFAGCGEASAELYRIEDRAEAIRFAIDHAQPEDTIVLAGKGHEAYQICGAERLPFSDSAHARLALRVRGDDSE